VPLRLDLAVDVPLVDHIAFGGRARNDVLGPALGLLLPARIEAVGPHVADRTRDAAFQRGVIVVGVYAANLGLEVVDVRTAGDFVQRPGDGVAAVERALRTAEHFDALEIERGTAGGNREGLIETVVIVGDRGVGGEHVGHAPD